MTQSLPLALLACISSHVETVNTPDKFTMHLLSSGKERYVEIQPTNLIIWIEGFPLMTELLSDIKCPFTGRCQTWHYGQDVRQWTHRAEISLPRCACETWPAFQTCRNCACTQFSRRDNTCDSAHQGEWEELLCLAWQELEALNLEKDIVKKNSGNF